MQRPPQVQQQVQMQRPPQVQQQVQMQRQPQVQQQVQQPTEYLLQQIPLQQTLIDTKSVTFNENVEQKTITPDNNVIDALNNTTNLQNEIKKIKLGKLMAPRITVIFTLILIAIATGLFFVTKPKKINKNEE